MLSRRKWGRRVIYLPAPKWLLTWGFGVAVPLPSRPVLVCEHCSLSHHPKKRGDVRGRAKGSRSPGLLDSIPSA